MNKESIKNIINYCNDKDIDYNEVFYEETFPRTISLSNNKIDKVTDNIIKGIGVRLAKDNYSVYNYTNDLRKKEIYKLCDNLKSKFKDKNGKNIVFKEEGSHLNVVKPDVKIIKDFLIKINDYARSKSDLITQVSITYFNSESYVTIGHNDGKIVFDTRTLSRLNMAIIVEKNGKTSESSFRMGSNNYYDFIKNDEVYKKIDACVKNAIIFLDAKSIKGKKMPVILSPGFGAVIFHEACGHSMEATSVAKNISVLSSKLGQKIASSKTTIIDDGTIGSAWGTTLYDDEGNKTRRNVLIENGVLKSYLVDKFNSKIMNASINGCGRRESYKYAPTSRMNNTFLAPGTDKIEDMIKSIKYGIYATSMGGGSVDPITGDFNFGVNESYLIENGKVTVPLRSISLIGNTLEILKNVEMVSDDFELESGMCGSESGYVPVTIGQPTIKISSILVGGADE